MNFLNIYILFFFLVAFFPRSIFSQNSPGAKEIALSHSNIASGETVFSVFNNPAGTAVLKDREIGFHYSPSPFGIKELSNGYAGYCEPTSIGNLSIGVMQFGFELYKENKFILSYGNELYDNFFMGVTLNYFKTVIKNYGDYKTFNFSVGSIFKLQNNLLVGFVIHNPLRPSDSFSNVSSTFSGGITYEPMQNANLNFSVHKEINFPFSFSSGFEYPIIEIIFLRIGIQREPDLYSGGIGINYSFFNLNYAVNSHNELGLTHQFDIILSF